MTSEHKQLVNISIAAGKFIMIHPQYELIREAMRLHVIEDERLEDFEVHNWQFEIGEIITYDIQEIYFFYALLEISCRIFICDIGDDLKKMAIESGETNEAEFLRVRGFYLRKAQDCIVRLREIFKENEEFRNLSGKIEQLNLAV